MKKQPEQTAHTRQTMIDAFWELAAKQGLDKVTISAITKRSKLNRSTFYVYFTDIKDLLEQAEDEIIRNLRTQIEKMIKNCGVIDIEHASQHLVDVFALYDEKLFLLMGKNGDPNFLSRIREEASNMYREIFKPADSNPYSEFIIAYATSAFTGLLVYWHDTGKTISIKELAAILRYIITKGPWEAAKQLNK